MLSGLLVSLQRPDSKLSWFFWLKIDGMIQLLNDSFMLIQMMAGNEVSDEEFYSSWLDNYDT